LTYTLLTHHPTNNTTMVSHLPLRQHGLSKSAHPTPGASSEGVIRGRSERILVALIIVRRKKLICKLNNVILVFNIIPTLSSPKRWIYTPPHAPRWSRHLSQYHLALLRLFFGWLLCVPSLIGGRLRPPNNLFVFIFHH
jgi:hypothetical protein